MTNAIVHDNQTSEPMALVMTPKMWQDDLVAAREKARTLAGLVEKQGLAVKIGPSKYLRFEAWQTLARGYGVTIETGNVEILREEGQIIGFKAYGWGLFNGVRMGGAEHFCFKDELWAKGKTLAQMASMAQTRAGAKTARQLFSWVVVLAGYSPTPAEEMEANAAQTRLVQ